MKTLYTPTDVDEAHEKFNATCGPCALAALVGKQVCELMTLAWPRGFQGWCSLAGMEIAMKACGLRETGRRDWPQHGMVWLTIEGPWRAPTLPSGARLSRSHWVAVDGEMVYDVNARTWLPRGEWEREVIQPWIAEIKNATGWSIIRGMEVAQR